MDVRVTRLWEALLACRRQAVAVCAAERDATLADAAGHIGKALDHVWEYVCCQASLGEVGRHTNGGGEGGDPPAPGRTNGAGDGGDPPAPERPTPGPAH